MLLLVGIIYTYICMHEHEVTSVMSDWGRLWPSGLQPTRLLCPWDSPGKNTGVGYHALLRGIFPTQGLNPGLLHWRQILYRFSYQESPCSFQIIASALGPRAWEILCVSSISHSPLGLPKVSPLAFKAKQYGGSSSQYRSPRLGSPMHR